MPLSIAPSTMAGTASTSPNRKWRTNGPGSLPPRVVPSRLKRAFSRACRGAASRAEVPRAISTSPLPCLRYHASMWGTQNHPDALPLEVCAEQAGAALACAYSNSAEFDAALIAARRAAGVYGPKRHRRQVLVTAAGIAAGLVAIAYLIV